MAQPNIVYQDVAPAAKLESNLSITDKEDYAKIDDLKLEFVTVPYFTTLEKNDWVLDGGHNLFPEDPTPYHWGLVSNSISDESGVFAEPPTLEIDFETLQTSIAITLDFDANRNEWCDVTINYFRDGEVIGSYDYTPNNYRFMCAARVEHYDKISIVFKKTSKPQRRARLQVIYYGIIRYFDVDDLSELSALEEVNPISEELSINTMEFAVKNTSDIEFLFQKMQPVQLFYGSDLIGTYFIETAQRTGKNNWTIQTQDSVGTLDYNTFYGGVYEDKNVKELIDELFTPINIPYELDSSYWDRTVSGYLPICSVREALLQIAFVLGAAVDDSRGDTIYIKSLSDEVVYEYNDEEVHADGTTNVNQTVTTVNVTAFSYSKGNEEKEIINTLLDVGTSTIKLDSPCYNYSISGGVIVDSGDNYVTFTVGTKGNVLIKGYQYISNSVEYSKKNPNLGRFDIENVKSVSNCTLVNTGNVNEILDRVYNHYMSLKEIECKIPLNNVKVGDKISIPTPYGENIVGRITSNSMSFGSKLRGNIKVITDEN